MFRKSPYLFDNYYKFYVTTEEDPIQITDHEERTMYENSNRKRESMISEIPQNQLSQHCRACEGILIQNDCQKCCACDFRLCATCALSHGCASCGSITCMSCAQEMLYEHQYYFVCPYCVQRLSCDSNFVFCKK